MFSNAGTILVKATESDTTTTIPTMGRSMPCFAGKEDFFDHGGYLQHWVAVIFSSDDLFEAPKVAVFCPIINCADKYYKIFNLKIIYHAFNQRFTAT